MPGVTNNQINKRKMKNTYISDCSPPNKLHNLYFCSIQGLGCSKGSKFTNMFITDNCQLEIDIPELK